MQDSQTIDAVKLQLASLPRLAVAELSVGRVDPWVGSGRAGSRNYEIFVGRVGSGQTFAVSIFVMLRYFEGME